MTPEQRFKNPLWATVAAFITAVVLLLTFILPIEYGLDYFGVGKRLGLLPETGESLNLPGTVRRQELPPLDHEVEFELNVFESVEYKFQLARGSALNYVWRADGELVSELHGEPAVGPPGYAQLFTRQRSAADQGTFVAPFAGRHGWFWENRGSQPVHLTLSINGFVTGAIHYRDGHEIPVALPVR